MKSLLAIAAVLLCLSESASRQRPDVNVPFVPIPLESVNYMLDMAQVGEDDLLFELGCGDGRITISAAGRGAKGIGIDTDARRVEECIQNANVAGVADRAKFYQSDIFGVPLASATVVVMYLMPEVNIQIRPKLFNELRPGTKVISYDFNMGEWEADSVIQIKKSTAYMWIMPANFSGTWSWFHVDGSERKFSLDLSQHYQQLTGTISSSQGSPAVVSMNVKGNSIRIILEEAEGERMLLTGTIRNNTMKGTIAFQNGTKLKWHAEREEGTVQPLFFPEDGI
ncbi:MAG: methyltransferase domain-containing protein [Chitinispirillaceae bacterium]